MSSPAPPEARFEVGDRVCLESSHFATIRYVGPVQGTPDNVTWVGLEWDDPSRGKHDGTHKGKKYFDVQSGHPNGGSFIKANKLQGGIGLIEAVKERYGVAQGEVQIDPQNVTALQREINAPFLEMVGFDKVNKIQGNFKNLKFISLKKMGIKGLGESLTNLTEWIPNVLEMDLDDNLLTSWDKLGEICQQLPRLRMLNVSGNRMKLPSDRKAHAQALAKVSHLVLGRMSLTWPDVLCLTQDLPSLKELQCYDNLITEIPDLPEGVFQNLENLDINSNNFQHWKYVCKFSLLPNLKYLNLNAIGLKKIELPNLTEGEAYFPALKWIQLSFNEINDWQSVANLVHLKVDEVRIRNNPILETEDGATVRQLFIASIPTLTLFNGSELLKTERYGAELDYLKKYGREYLDIQKIEKPDSKNAAWKAFTLRHPRYDALAQRYGAPEEDELRQIDTSIKGTMVELVIECPSNPDFQSVKKRIPKTLTIQKFRPLIARIVKKKRDEIQISVRSIDDPNIEVELVNDLRQLSFYSLQDGDTIIAKWE